MLISLFWKLMQVISPQYASAGGRILLGWLGPKTHKHRHVMRNLEQAFPELGYSRRESVARDIWGNFGAVIAEYPHLSTLTNGGSPPFIKLVIDKETNTILDNKQPAIYVSAHLGNWELVASTLAKSGVPLSVIYGPQRNPVLERLIQEQRGPLGYRLIAKTNGIRQLVREIRSMRSVGLLPDQRVDSGVSIPFFGLNAPTSTSPAWMAKKLVCPLIPVQVERIDDARYRIILHRPILNPNKTDEQRDPVQITTDLNRLFESWIRDQPGQWLCMKRRWPKRNCNMPFGRDTSCD